MYVPSSEFGLSLSHNPSLASECAPPPRTGGGWGGRGHTSQRVRGWGSPNSDDWRKSSALCLLCVLTVCEKSDVPTDGQKKELLLPLLFSYGGIAKTIISTDFDISMVFKICSYLDEKRSRTFIGPMHFTSQRCQIFFLTAKLFTSLAASDLKKFYLDKNRIDSPFSNGLNYGNSRQLVVVVKPMICA
jgi:hypothetical protein